MPKNSILTITILAFALLTTPTAFADHTASTEKSTHYSISEIGSSSDEWNKTIATLIKEPLWNLRDAYDASHTLMVPMHFAFASADIKGIKQFEYLMSKFARQELPGGQLNQAQWLYFVTRYLALKAEFNYDFSKMIYTLYKGSPLGCTAYGCSNLPTSGASCPLLVQNQESN